MSLFAMAQTLAKRVSLRNAFGIYTVLCQLAEVHLSASASAVPVECLFSSAGLVANSKRCSLSAKRLHRICFIHDNFKFCL